MRWAAKLKDAENTVAAVGQRRVCHVAVGTCRCTSSKHFIQNL